MSSNVCYKLLPKTNLLFSRLEKTIQYLNFMQWLSQKKG